MVPVLAPILLNPATVPIAAFGLVAYGIYQKYRVTVERENTKNACLLIETAARVGSIPRRILVSVGKDRTHTEIEFD